MDWAGENGQILLERKAHPLTTQPSLDSAWDFDKLFSKNRTWFGGARVFEQRTQARRSEHGNGGMDVVDEHAERTGRTMAKGRGGRPSTATRKSPLSEELEQSGSSAEMTPIATQGDEAGKLKRQQEVFGSMRKAAMERLSLLGAHLAWSASSVATVGATVTSSCTK